MKKFSLAVIALLVVSIVMCSCSKNDQPASNNAGDGVVNPVGESTLEDVAKELKLKQIALDDSITVGDVTKIEGDPAIYSIDITKDEKQYNIRLSSDNGDDDDISGLYLSGDIENSIFDSEDINVAPSISIDSASDGQKAYCRWKGCRYSLSTTDNVSTYSFHSLTVELAQTIINRSEFTLIFEKSNQAKLVNIVEKGTFPVNVYYGNVYVIVNGTKYPLAEAIKKRVISPADILNQCEQDVDDGKIECQTIKDGGSKVYQYKKYSVLKMNVIDGANDMIIGPSDSIMDAYDLYINN